MYWIEADPRVRLISGFWVTALCFIASCRPGMNDNATPSKTVQRFSHPIVITRIAMNVSATLTGNDHYDVLNAAPGRHPRFCSLPR